MYFRKIKVENDEKIRNRGVKLKSLYCNILKRFFHIIKWEGG